MRTVVCDACGETVPQNNAYRVQERTLCDPCTDVELEHNEDIPQESVVHIPDPTICGICDHDAGTVELPTVVKIHVCETCEQLLRKRPFPDWVKSSFAAILVFAFAGLIYNYRFFQAFAGHKQAVRAAAQGDFVTATRRMTTAAKAMPEMREFLTMAKFYQGLLDLQADRNADALANFQAVIQETPHNRNVQSLILQAEIGLAYDSSDYQRMAKLSQELAQLNPDQNMMKLIQASAFACLYVAHGEETARRQAVKLLPTAAEWPSLPREEQQLANQIEHRLTTKEIIDSQEFKRRFPSGWRKGADSP